MYIFSLGPTCSPVTCRMFCQFGFMRDRNGCEICQCNPAPAPPTGAPGKFHFNFVFNCKNL